MQETEQAMHHEEAVQAESDEAKEDEGEADESGKNEFQNTLNQQTLKNLKDAENAPPRGRFSNADLND